MLDEFEFDRKPTLLGDESLACMTGQGADSRGRKRSDETQSESDEEETQKRVREQKEKLGIGIDPDSDEDDDAGFRNASIMRYQRVLPMLEKKQQSIYTPILNVPYEYL